MPAGNTNTDVSGVNRLVPTATAGANAGGSPPAPVVSANSEDNRGSVTFGSGTVPAAGVVLNVVFNTPRDANRLPIVQITELTTATAAVNPAVTTVSATGFSVSTGTALTASQANTVYGLAWLVAD